MGIYIICFAITIIVTYIAEINFKKKKYIFGIFFSIIAILIPSILAGFRANSVGTDTALYVDVIFEKAKVTGILSDFINATNVEKGYSILVYLVAQFTTNVHYLYFISELIICFFIYFTLYKERKKSSMWMGMTVFLFIFYNVTLNLARQSLAIAIVIYSIVTMKNKKYIKTILLYLIAIQFHNSAVLAGALYAIIFIENSKMDTKAKNKIYAIIFTILFVSLTFYESIINFLANDLKILAVKYMRYVENSSDTDINYFTLLYKLIWIGMYVLYANIMKNKKNNENIGEYKIYFLMLLVDLAILIISFRIVTVFRVGHYYGVPGMMLVVSELSKIFKDNRENRILGKFFIIMLLFVYWFYGIILLDAAGTYPYVSDVFELLNF